MILDGALYVFAINKVLRYDNIEDKLDAVPQPVDLSEKFCLPGDAQHGWKYVKAGPDGKIYVPVGVPCNICEVNPATHGHLRRYDPEGLELRDRRARHPQLRRLRLASGDEGAVVHRQRPRLGWRQRPGGRD